MGLYPMSKRFSSLLEFFAKHLDDPFTKAFFIQQLSCTAREEKYEYGKVDRISGKQHDHTLMLNLNKQLRITLLRSEN